MNNNSIYINYPNNNNTTTSIPEGDPCPLGGGERGVCRKASQCQQSDQQEALRCEFDGSDAVICCAQPPNATLEQTVQQFCISARSVTNDLTDHVVGDAVAAEQGEFPFMGLLTYKEKMVRCGASLISERFLLTAAHCVPKKEPPIGVLLGTTDADDSGADMYEVAEVYPYRSPRKNDIALIELKRPVEMNSHVQPICLHTDLIDLPPSTNLTVMGWGHAGNNYQYAASDILLKGAIKLVLRSSCQATYKQIKNKNIRITENIICAIGKKNDNGTTTDSCQGDSGGPLVLRKGGKYYLVGIVATGFSCGSELPGIYTRVSSYLDWIIEKGTCLSGWNWKQAIPNRSKNMLMSNPAWPPCQRQWTTQPGKPDRSINKDAKSTVQ